MSSAFFRFGPSGEHDFRIECGYFGRERYYVNGKLVHSCWSLHLRRSREFQVKGHTVRIDTAIDLKRIEADAFVDGKLVATDLFAEQNERFARQRGLQPRKLGINFVIWFFIGLLTMVLLRALNVTI